MNNEKFLETFSAQANEHKCDSDRLVALAKRALTEKDNWRKRTETALAAGIMAVTIAERAVADSRKWENRAEATKAVMHRIADKAGVDHIERLEMFREEMDKRNPEIEEEKGKSILEQLAEVGISVEEGPDGIVVG